MQSMCSDEQSVACRSFLSDARKLRTTDSTSYHGQAY